MDRKNEMTSKKSRDIERTIYTDWANHHLEKTGVKRLIQDLPKDISDGLLLVDIVHFVCGQNVERIHAKPSTTKQKLHNIDRCLQVLEANNVVLNDVTAQGIYRCELKCVLALFFHLSRYKQKVQDFKMADGTRSVQRRGLKPPSAVAISRKSRSFNANDRNRISTGEPNGIPPPSTVNKSGLQQPAQQRVANLSATGGTGWRSKSMSSKHSATTRLVPPKSHGSSMQTFKPNSNHTPRSSNPSSSQTSLASDSSLAGTNEAETRKLTTVQTRLGSPSRIRTPRRPISSALVHSTDNKSKTNGLATKIVSNKERSPSQMKTPAKTIPKRVPTAKPTKPTSPSRSKTSTPKSGLEQPSKLAPNGTKTGSVISRLRRLGSQNESNNTPTAISKPRSTSLSKSSVNSVAISSGPGLKKRAESVPPTSRLATNMARPSIVKKDTSMETEKTKTGKTTTNKTLKSPSGLKSVKSTIGKAFGASKQADKKNSKISTSSVNGKPEGFKSKLAPKSSAQRGGKFTDKPGITISNPIPHIVSPPTEDDKLANVIFTELPTFSQPRDVTSNSSTPSSEQPPPLPPKDNPTPTSKHEPVSVSVGSRIHKPQLTATVAPFMRQPPLGSAQPNDKPVNQKRPDSILKYSGAEKAQSQLSVCKNQLTITTSLESMSDNQNNGNPGEARQRAVKGIANLRQNLEDTMCSLRSTQLRHKNGDAFQRRISAQLDGVEYDNLADISPMSRSSNIYRSHHNLLGSHTTPRPRSNYQVNGSASPKLHAGETMGHDADYKFAPGRFCSLQRTRSARGPRPAWRDVTPVPDDSEGNIQAGNKPDNKGYISDEGLTKSDSKKLLQNWEAPESGDDISSVSSGDISDCIADISTDELSSNNNSPFHKVKPSTAPSTPASKTEVSSMAIENANQKIMKRKGFGKPPSGKIGLPSGSNVVGSRLACNVVSTSPSLTNSPLQNIVGNQRGTLAYRSLPRPTKNKFMENGTKTPLSNETSSTLNHANRKSATFKRSPSLQKLLGFGKPKQNMNEEPENTNNNAQPIKQTNPSSTNNNVFNDNDKLIIKPMPDFTTSDRGTLSKNRELGHYNTLGRPKKTSMNGNQSTSPLSYLSLPRKSSPRNYLSTASSLYPTSESHDSSGLSWTSPKRPNANSAYSISPTSSNPFMSLDLLTTPSLYLDDKDSNNLNESFDKHGFSNGKSQISDWPLPTLLSSTTDTSSNTNRARSVSRASSNISGNSPEDNYHHSSMFSLSHENNQHKSNLTKNRAHSLMSSTPSLYSLPEDNVPQMKIQMERENGIQSHISSSAKMVSVFEQSLSTMNNRLRELSVSAEEKDSELQELRNTIESLKKTQSPEGSEYTGSEHPVLRKKASCGSLSSISSKTSMSSIGSTEDGLKFKKKKNWLRSSIKTAFAKRKSRSNLSAEFDEMEENNQNNEKEDSDVVAKLKEELLNKERKLTDIRLEALTSQHQLHQMQDAMQRMRSEMETLRQENYRLNRLGRSTMSLNMPTSPHQTERPASTISFSSDILMRDSSDTRITIICEFAEHLIDDENTDRRTESKVVLAVCYIPRSAGWLQLDHTVQQAFQNYCLSVDPTTSLGLTAESVISYSVGDANRLVNGDAPALLPCGFIVGDVDTINVNLGDGNGPAIESLALELLIEKETLQKYVKLLLEHGRVMLCGPAGTGKTTLANRLAEHVVQGTSKRLGKGAIVRLDVKNRTENEIREYLYQLSEDCSKPESCGREIPVVLVIDDLRVSSSLNEAFQPLLTTSAHSQLPYLIGVVRQDHGSGLQLHHEFRWIMCSNHTPPVNNFLARSLRRALTKIEILNADNIDEEIAGVVNWLPKCWQHVNKCIELYNSADVTLGPRIFCACPMNGTSSRVWFTDLWNFSIVPYIISAVKQGHSKGKMWMDPVQWIKESWPWTKTCDLHSIRAEDVALDNLTMVPTDNNKETQPNDPLLNMLIKLQEAAATNYESDNSHDDAFERSVDRALGELT